MLLREPGRHQRGASSQGHNAELHCQRGIQDVEETPKNKEQGGCIHVPWSTCQVAELVPCEQDSVHCGHCVSFTKVSTRAWQQAPAWQTNCPGGNVELQDEAFKPQTGGCHRNAPGRKGKASKVALCSRTLRCFLFYTQTSASAKANFTRFTRT